MAETTQHMSDVLQTGLHVRTSSGEDGACLNRHIAKYSKSSCSHRWQGYRKAEENTKLYNSPAYDSLTTSVHPETSTHITRIVQLGHFPGTLQRPNKKDWDVGVGNNFKSSCRVPYWHQSHHLIPNSVMQSCIADAAKTDVDIYKLLRRALLEAKYNLNHKINMVILPMSKTIGDVLHLPRHITGIEGAPGTAAEFTSHTVYNNKVKAKLQTVMAEFAEQIDKKEHKEEAGDFARSALEKISKGLFGKLVLLSSVKGGVSVSELAPFI